MIELGDITVHNLKQLKRLNSVVFPVSYNERFYKDILEVDDLAKLGTKFEATNIRPLIYRSTLC